MNQLRCLTAARDGTPDETLVNAALNIVNGSRPKNEIQACLLAQMVATHLLAMKSATAAMQLSNGYGVPEREVALTAKLVKAFADQCVALDRLQNGGRKQRIAVTHREEKHVHMHHHYPPGRGGSDFGGQAHEPSELREQYARADLAPAPNKQLGENGHGGGEIIDADAVPALEPPQRAEVWGPDPSGNIVPMPLREGAAEVPEARGSDWKWRPDREAERELEARRVHGRRYSP